MENIIIYYQKYFLELISIIVAIVSLLLIIQKEYKTNIAKYFIAYLLCYISISILALINVLYNSNSQILALGLSQPLTDYLFTIYEFYIFSLILMPTIPKWVYKFGSLIFFTTCPILLYFGWPWHLNKNYFHLQCLYFIQTIILLIFISFYFFSLYKSSSTFSNESSFWIATGLTFFLITTLPFTIISNFLFRSKVLVFYDLFSIIPMLYSILFIFIIIGLNKQRLKSLANQV